MPARFKRVERALRRLGVHVEKHAGKGSHAILDDGKGHIYPLPLHNGAKTELSDVYLRGLCRALALDYEAFRKLL